ncbi:MAG: diphosphomevalonate decarboxylase [Spirochaetales bacterium]
MSVTAVASPSLALTKYWGKQSNGVNLPATSSLAITLGSLETRTTASFSDGTANDHTITINGWRADTGSYSEIIDEFRRRASRERSMQSRPLLIESVNTFPTAAGVASSSSGFAALALALDRLYETNLSRSELSAIARTGSGSASRALFGGFTTWDAGASAATEFLPASHWPELRVLVAVVSTEKKPVSSREAMTRARETSPYYGSWVSEAPDLFEDAKQATVDRDLAKLGELMRASYLQMFATMFTARPPVVYWLPESLAVIHAAEALRSDGVPVWETMDAGPQVKLLTTEDKVPHVESTVQALVPGVQIIHSVIGGEPRVDAS